MHTQALIVPKVEDRLGSIGLVFLLHPSTSSIPESLSLKS